ncbi:MAG: hypothetical protein ACHP6H_02755 [Legionellales bacterium]
MPEKQASTNAKRHWLTETNTLVPQKIGGNATLAMGVLVMFKFVIVHGWFLSENVKITSTFYLFFSIFSSLKNL